MFTVKHVSLAGIEALYAIDGPIIFLPKGLADGTGPNAASLPKFTWDDGKHELFGGTIFVMNEKGKTVARYDLGASPVPFADDGVSDPRPRGLAGLDVGRASVPVPPRDQSY